MTITAADRVLADRITTTGQMICRYGLVIVLAWIGWAST